MKHLISNEHFCNALQNDMQMTSTSEAPLIVHQSNRGGECYCGGVFGKSAAWRMDPPASRLRRPPAGLDCQADRQMFGLRGEEVTPPGVLSPVIGCHTRFPKVGKSDILALLWTCGRREVGGGWGWGWVDNMAKVTGFNSRRKSVCLTPHWSSPPSPPHSFACLSSAPSVS